VAVFDVRETACVLLPLGVLGAVVLRRAPALLPLDGLLLACDAGWLPPELDDAEWPPLELEAEWPPFEL
jgi:hypothetical protein